MIKINFKNILEVDGAHGLSQSEIDFSSEDIKSALLKIHERKQGFYEILDDAETILKINDFANSVKNKYKYIVVLGIGGSALGTITLQKSLKHEYGCQLAHNPQLFVLDNIDPDYIKEVEEVLDLTQTLFIVVSKSGNTVETLSQYFYFRKKIETLDLLVKDHFVFITDPQTGLLRETANAEGIKSFKIPENVGGRFSVLTPVSLLPARLMGLQIGDLIDGAKLARDKFLSLDPTENLPYLFAKLQHGLYQKGKVMNVMMPYSNKLAPVTEWYSQLLAESIGKDGIGITPIEAKGVTDQHSQNQLYHDGPNDKLIVFVEVENFKNKLDIPNYYPEHPAVSYLGKTSFNELIALEAQGTQDSLTAKDRPNLKLSVPNLTEKSLGELFFMLEASIAFLGELFKVNAYDQPGVELSKQLTKKYYERKA
jgi:glucose-6-phosphate isomerase